MKTIWIIGASSGIGADLARLYAHSGWQVIISARRADVLADVAASAPQNQIHTVPLDVADPEACKNATDQIITQYGFPDLVVTNASLWFDMGLDDFDRDKIASAMNVNYLGAINIIDAMLPYWQREKRGQLGLVGSVAGYRGLARSLAYAPTKAALINLAEGLKTHLGALNVDVSLVSPGFVDTPMTQVNKFPMPGMISSERAARYMKDGFDKRKYEIAFPPLFTGLMQFVRIMPNWLFHWLNRRIKGQLD